MAYGTEVWKKPNGETINVDWDRAAKEQTAGAKQRGEKFDINHFMQETRNQYIRNGYTRGGAAGTPPATGGGGGGGGTPATGGGGGGESSPSMAGLMDASGAGTMGAGSLLGPSKFRQGIGTRIQPQMSMSLAALKQIY